MPIHVVPLIARRINAGNEFGYTPLIKKSPTITSWAATFEDESPRATFTTRDEAYFFAVKLVIDNLDALPICSEDCDCGWYEQELYLHKKKAFEKAGLPVPMPEGHISHAHCCCPEECPACACPIELCKHNGSHCGCLGCDEDAVQDCALGLEERTREFIELQECLQREHFEKVIELWNVMWDDIYEDGNRYASDAEYRITVFKQVGA